MHLYKSPFPSHPPPQRPSRLQHGSVSAGFLQDYSYTLIQITSTTSMYVNYCIIMV